MNRTLAVATMGLIVLGFDSLQSVPFSAQEPRELIVCPEGCPFTRIQEAIDAAQEGDTIKILAGTYKETLFISKGITLQGTVQRMGFQITFDWTFAPFATLGRRISSAGEARACWALPHRIYRLKSRSSAMCASFSFT